MNERKELELGDVFVSKKLVKCTYRQGEDEDDNIVPDMDSPKDYNGDAYVHYTHKENGKDGWKRERERVSDLRAYDATRGKAEFVVVEIDDEPDGGHYRFYNRSIIASRLNEDGTYHPENERVKFNQSGNYSNCIYPEEMDYKRTMKQTFVGE